MACHRSERDPKVKKTFEPPVDGQSRPVQIQQIREVADGDVEFERELIETFLLDGEEQIRRLEVALRDQDAEEVRVRAHTIKGSSASAGAILMQELACQMEQIGAGKELAQAPNVYSELKDAFEQSRELLLAHLRSLESPAEELPREDRKDPLSGV
jgi:HPt (histidine-containing phosphotransfer) domain-containing protein